MNKWIDYFAKRQKTLFLVDSLGAMLTALFLLVIMRGYHSYVGMPKEVLVYLGVIAICFSVYSGACCLFLKGPGTPFIRLIAFANMLYCALTIGLMIAYYPLLSVMAVLYFGVEGSIILGLSYVEFRVATEIKTLQER